MPNEIISQCDGERLCVGWGRPDETVDPKVYVGHWVTETDPDGTPARWRPVATHWDLDRTALNHLIRTLRRARDQVFGRDE